MRTGFTFVVGTIIGLSFERLYLMEGLNLIIAKSADFGKYYGFQISEIAYFENHTFRKTADFARF